MIIAINEDGDFLVTWALEKKEHVITYGLEERRYKKSTEAGKAFGLCVRHSLECAGKLDNVR